MTIELTKWEREKLWGHAAAKTMTYIGHHSAGWLKPDEIEEMERWKALSAKLTEAPPPAEMAIDLSEFPDLPPDTRISLRIVSGDLTGTEIDNVPISTLIARNQK